MAQIRDGIMVADLASDTANRGGNGAARLGAAPRLSESGPTP